MADGSPSQLVQYVKDTLKQGYSEQQVRQVLQSNGYDQTSIDQAFSLAKGEGPQGAAKPVSHRTNVLGVVALVLAIIGPILEGISPRFFLQGDLTLVFAGAGVLAVLAALVLGIVSLRQIRRRKEQGKVLAILAIVFGGLSVLGTLLLIAGLLFMGSVFSAGTDALGSLASMEASPGVDRVGPPLEMPEGNGTAAGGGGCSGQGGMCASENLCAQNNASRMPSLDGSCDGSKVCCESPFG